MTFPCARALRICALLAMPTTAIAQSTRSPTIFSQSSQVGTVNVRAAVVLADYSVKPLPLLKVVARRADRADSVTAQTDLDGRLTMTLPEGRYTLRAKALQPVAGRSYAWTMPVVVRASRTESLQLTNANASISDSVATAAAATAAPAQLAPATATPASNMPSAAPVTASRPAPAPSKPVVERPAPPVERQAVVAVDSARNVAPAPAAAAPRMPTPSPRPAMVRAAPRTNTSKLLLGLSLSGSALRSDDLNSSTESGAGLAAQLGWGFTKNFAIVVDASAARIEGIDGNFDLAHVDVGGRWHFVSSSHGFVPFVEVGYSGRAATKNDALMADGNGNTYTGDLAILGGGVSFGGGLQYFISQKWALGGTFKWTTGEFTRVQIDNVSIDGFAIDATSARFNMGFTWFPVGRGR